MARRTSASFQEGAHMANVEQQVEAIWRDVLGAPQDRPDATFFDLQGQSISAVRIITRIEDELGVSVDVGLLFEDPDLATFTRAVVETIQAAGNRAA
jgi:acyl carrier protein